MDGHVDIKAKDIVDSFENSNENEQDTCSSFSEDAALESAKTKSVSYSVLKGAIDNDSFTDSYFVNASEKQSAIVRETTLCGSSSEISHRLDDSGQREIAVSRLRGKPVIAKEHQRE